MGIDNVLYAHRHTGKRAFFRRRIDRARLRPGEIGIEKLPGADDRFAGVDMRETGIEDGLSRKSTGGNSGGYFSGGQGVESVGHGNRGQFFLVPRR